MLLKLRMQIENDDKSEKGSGSSAALKSGKALPDEQNENDIEDLAKMISCFALLMPNRNSVTSANMATATTLSGTSHKDIMITAAAAASTFGYKEKNSFYNPFSIFEKYKVGNNANLSGENANKLNDISMVTPGAFSFVTQKYNPKPLSEKLTMDLNDLKKQYEKLKERQRQAYIIMQTASHQHKQNSNSGYSGGGNINSPYSSRSNISAKSTGLSLAREKTFVKSDISPFCMLEKAPVVNHLLIKSSDPTKNTLKQNVHLANGSEAGNRDLNKLIQQSNSVLEQIFKDSNDNKRTEENPAEQAKPKNVYYSDDEDDDDDYGDDGNEKASNSDEYDDNYWNKKNKNSKNTELGEDFYQNRRLSLDEVNRMNLIELANLDPYKNKFINKQESCDGNALSPEMKANYLLPPSTIVAASSVSSSSSSSPISSPVLNSKTSTTETAEKLNVKNATRNENKPRKNTSKQMSTSDVINNLINEEKRQATPLNPFPRTTRHANSFLAKNGLRLGLYK